MSPRASVTVTPIADDTFRMRAAVSRRASAPGAEEFVPPSTGLWLPPERTFSPLVGARGFVPQEMEHVEVAAEREWAGELVTGVRAFRQTVDDQIVTLFGVVSCRAPRRRAWATTTSRQPATSTPRAGA